MYSLCMKLPELTWLAYPIRLKAIGLSIGVAAYSSWLQGKVVLIPKPKSYNCVFIGPTKHGKDTGTGRSGKKPAETGSVKKLIA